MTEQAQFEVLAKLDGWTLSCDYNNQASRFYLNAFKDRFCDGMPDWKYLPFQPYIHSRDAIIALIEKVCTTLESKDSFVRYLCCLFNVPMPFEANELHFWFLMVTATPAQLCEALLRAMNLWKD